MRSRSGFYVLLGVTVLMVAAAFFSQRAPEKSTDERGLLLPGLGARVDDVRTVRIATAAGELRLARVDDGWIAETKDGYPADASRIRELVLGISRLERLEKKTSDPDRYAALELTDVDQAGSRAVHITLLDDAGERVAGLLLGKTRDFQSSGRSRYFVRVAGEAQSWLVEGVLPPVPEEFRNWLQQTLLPGVAKSDFRGLRVEHADGDALEIVNPAAGSGSDFRLAGGEDTSNPQAIDAVAGTLQGLALKDVREAPAGFPPSPALTVAAVTVDGMRIVARFSALDEDYEVRLEATPDPGGGAGDDAATDTRQRIKALNDRWAGRVFTVSRYAVDSLEVRRSDLVEAPAGSAGD